jgi:hypothetical protein
MKASNSSEKHIRAIAERFDALLLTLPRIRPSITTPAMGSVNGSQGEREPERLSDRRRSCDPAPVFGPAVVMVMVTGVPVEAVPAAIDDGVKAQLVLVSVGSAGEKLQLNAT